MGETVILPETELAFEYVAAFDAYGHTIDPLPFVFTKGFQYIIMWDGIEYVRTAFAFTSADGSLCVAVGNPLAAGESSNGDPFAIVCETTNEYLYLISTEVSDAHTVSISLTDGIVLKDRNGNDVAYYGIETVTFDTTTEGKQQTYTKGTAVEGLEIVPDFSGGDMPVSTGEGVLVKSATIKKPDTLTPENIRNGAEVAGVVGGFIGDTEEQTVALAMADGDMVIEPSAVGKVLSKVLVQKPETLAPENIAEGVDIAGIIGTFAGMDTDAPKVLIKKISGTSETTGTLTLATAEELEGIGFADASKKFAILLTSSNSLNSGELSFSLICSWDIGYAGTASRNAVYGYCYKSGSYLQLGTVTMYAKISPTNTTTYTNTIFGNGGELVYNLGSTYKLRNSANPDYYLIVGVIQ